jgi:hypothetical protein
MAMEMACPLTRVEFPAGETGIEVEVCRDLNDNI